MTDYEKIKELIATEVTDKLSEKLQSTDDEVIKTIDAEILSFSRNHSLSLDDKLNIRKDVFNKIRRLDVIQDLLDDESVTEVMVNGTSEIFVEREGKIFLSGKKFESEERILDIVGQIASFVNRTVNIAEPIMDARLSDGSRVNVVLPPVALNGPIITIRRFPNKEIGVAELLKFNAISEEVISFLKKLITAKYNILISGGTGAGKTTFLNVCSNFIPKDERIITIEDSAELKIAGIENLVKLEARQATAEGVKRISIRDLIKTSLRMRPDRIVVGEVRGEEAIDMLQAFNVGQDGSLSTIHANSAEDALLRLETMIMLNTEIPLAALRRQIASGVDIIVHLGRLRDKSRKLLEIREVIGMKNEEVQTKMLYEFCETAIDNGTIKGDFVKKNNVYHRIKLNRSGILDEI